MKKLFLMSLLLVSSSVHAEVSGSYDDACKNRYRDATLNLLSACESFNDRTITPAEFTAQFSGIEVMIGALRVACLGESQNAAECSYKYKKVYQRLKSKFSVSDIVAGNQEHISDLGWIEARLVPIDLVCQ